MNHSDTIGNGSIPLRIGNLINTRVYGGPYSKRPERMFGVLMAEELIGLPCDTSIPTRDFSIPEDSDVRIGVMRALMAMVQGREVYAGCMGGIGRTGLFLGILAKLQIEYRRSKHRKGRGDDPVVYVRKHFIPHAIETQAQQNFVRNFDVSDMVEWIDITQRAMGKNIGFTAVQPEVEPSDSGDELTADWGLEEDWEGSHRVTIINTGSDGGVLNEGVHYRLTASPLSDLVERDLDWDWGDDEDWLTAEEPDSGALSTPDEKLNALYETVDMLYDKVEALTESVDRLSSEKTLTNATFFEKIRLLFK